ncbi:MAG: NERD domain-containing protein, partial [Fimbriimonadaceae bacterium]|nr:NERD domain-containing protein [Fimbriimonadaceae bacterium]
MATLIPDPIPSRSSHGERELARILRKLPEDWTVYHEPSVRGLRPDFVILAPSLGVLVLEVKDWKLGSLQSLDTHWVERQAASAAPPKREKNPLRQVDNYWRALKDECQGNLFGQALVQREGPWRGNLCFPVGAAVV